MQASRDTRRPGRGQGKPSLRPRGLFHDGLWLCECTPRVPATRFQVKKEGPNKGRWFYTCQRPEGERCKFFLWREEAEPREQRAVFNNTRSESYAGESRNAGSSTNTTPHRAPSGNATSSPPPVWTAPQMTTPTKPRRQRSPGADEYGTVLTGDEADGAMRSAESSRHWNVETPRKAIKTDAFATPHSIDRAQGEPSSKIAGPSSVKTPQSLYQTPRTGVDTHGTSTPTPMRYRDATAGSGFESPLVDEVFQTLRDKRVNFGEAEEALQHVLGRHILRTQGIIKGRDIARLGLKAKDAKLAELQSRVSTLEAELETERATVEHLKWQMETGEIHDL